MKSFLNLNTINHGQESTNVKWIYETFRNTFSLIVCEHFVMYNVFTSNKSPEI
jgi:hypothetical protein